MKKLYTANGDFVEYIGGVPVIGNKQYTLEDEDSLEVRRLAEAGKIKSLEGFSFPMEANNIEYKRYLRENNGSITSAAESYLADLLSGKSNDLADADATAVSKETAKPKPASKSKTTTEKEVAVEEAETKTNK